MRFVRSILGIAVFGILTPSGGNPQGPPTVGIAISGIISTAAGQGIPGVTVAFSNGGPTVITDANGSYTAPVSVGYSGSATPALSGYAFSPVNRSYNNVLSTQTQQNYTGTFSTAQTQTLSVSQASLSFSYQIGSSPPSSQTFTANVSTGSAAFTAVSDSPGWLQVTPASGTLGTSSTSFTVSVTPAGLTAGNYTGKITVAANGSSASPQTITVALNVTNAPTQNGPSLSLTGGPLTFNFTLGGNSPITQFLFATVSSGTAAFTAASNVAWLQVSPTTGTLGTSATAFGISIATANLAAGTYTGTVTVTTTGASNGPQSATIALIVTNASGNPPSGYGPTAGVFSHVADGGGWQTSITLVNLDTAAATYILRLYDDRANAFSPVWQNVGASSTLTGSIPLGGSQTFTTTGSALATTQGWAKLDSNQLLGGMAIFRYNGQEAAVPLSSSGSTRLFFPFDNSPGLGTGMALAVPDKGLYSNEQALFMEQNASGTPLGPQTVISMTPNGHTSFVSPVLSTQLLDLVGTDVINSTADPMYGLGIRSRAIGNNKSTFTSVEAIVPKFVTTQTISHLADGSGWKTIIMLVNSDSVPASFTINFWKDDGTPFYFPLASLDARTSLTETIGPGSVVMLSSAGTAQAVTTGWAEVLSNQSVGGTAIFQWQTNGQEASVPFLSNTSATLVFPWENGPGISLGIALVNPSPNQDAVVKIVTRDESGNLIGSGSPFTISRHQHFSVVIDDDNIVQRGTVEIDSSVELYGLGIRYNAGAFTSVRALPKPTSTSVPVISAP